MLTRRTIIELVYLDGSGSTGSMAVHIPPDTTFDDADASADVLASVVASLTGGVLVRRRITYIVVRDPTTAPLDGSDVVRRGVFTFANGDNDVIGLCEVPGILDSTLLDTGPCAGICIDLSNSDITAFIAAIIDNGATDPFATAFDHIFSAYLQSRV